MAEVKKTTLWSGSHINVLVRILDYIDKPVLELGMGYNSTPIIHWMAKQKGLGVISLESDIKWLSRFEEFEDEGHKISYYDFEHEGFSNAQEMYFGLVFVDHRPARKRRSSAKAFALNADFVVLHDSELADNPAYKYRPVYDDFKYGYEYKSVGTPYTMVLSNYIDPREVFDEKTRKA